MRFRLFCTWSALSQTTHEGKHIHLNTTLGPNDFFPNMKALHPNMIAKYWSWNTFVICDCICYAPDNQIYTQLSCPWKTILNLTKMSYLDYVGHYMWSQWTALMGLCEVFNQCGCCMHQAVTVLWHNVIVDDIQVTGIASFSSPLIRE